MNQFTEGGKVGPERGVGVLNTRDPLTVNTVTFPILSETFSIGSGLLLLFWSTGLANGQDFIEPLALELADQSTELFPAAWDASEDGEGVLFGLGVSGAYDSNLFLDDSDEVSDVSLSLNPWLRYSSAPPGGALWTLNARYSPVMRRYLDQDSLDATDQSGDVFLGYEGAVTRFKTSATYSISSAANRFEGGQAETEQIGLRAEGAHTLSDLTSLRMDFSHSDSQTTGTMGASRSDSQTTVASFSVLWDVTPLMKIGPTLRGSQQASQTLGDTETVGLLLTVDYELSGLTQLQVSAGAEQVLGGGGVGFTGGLSLNYQAPDLPWSLSADLQYGEIAQVSQGSRYGGGGDSPFSGSVRLSYEFAEMWRLQGGLRFWSFPSPGGDSYSVNDLEATLSVERELGSGSLGAGVSIGNSEYESVNGAAPREDDQTQGAFLQHQMLVFSDRATLDSSVRISTSEGSRDSSRWLLSVGLNHTF